MTGNKKPRKRFILQQRDTRLLQALKDMRIFDREQARRVGGFGSITRINTRLLKMTRAGLLRRYFMASAAGGAKALYCLSPRGALAAGVPYRSFQRKQDEGLVADFFVQHQLLVNEIFIAVSCETPANSNPRVIRWLTFQNSVSQAVPIIPDGYFEIECGQVVQPIFLEVDLGTESARTWEKKVQAYLRLALSGEFQSRFHQPRFRTLVVTASERRRDSIRKTVRRFTDKIFWFSPFESINREGLWSAIWLRPEGDQKHSLVSSL